MVRFNWTDNSGTGAALATDKVMLVVYCPELNQAVFVTEPDPQRPDSHHQRPGFQR
jgi:hypothetical protein